MLPKIDSVDADGGKWRVFDGNDWDAYSGAESFAGVIGGDPLLYEDDVFTVIASGAGIDLYDYESNRSYALRFDEYQLTQKMGLLLMDGIVRHVLPELREKGEKVLGEFGFFKLNVAEEEVQ